MLPATVMLYKTFGKKNVRMSPNLFVTKTLFSSYVAKKSGPFFNPCVARCSHFIPPENQENLSFSGVFRKHKKWGIGQKWVNKIL